MRTVEALAASCTLLTASLFAHILAGGAPLSMYSGLALLLLSLALAAFLGVRSDDPLRAAFLIFLSQNFTHLFLGGSSESGYQMLLSHLLSGLLSYRLLRYFIAELPSLGSIILRFFIRSLPIYLISIEFTQQIHHEHNLIDSGTLYSKLFFLRAPPLAT